jgi:hypothetical protein
LRDDAAAGCEQETLAMLASQDLGGLDGRVNALREEFRRLADSGPEDASDRRV